MHLIEVTRTYNSEGKLFLNEDAIDTVRKDVERLGIKYFVVMRSGIEYQITSEDFNNLTKAK